MKPTLTGFIIGMVLISFSAGFIGIFMSSLSNSYNVEIDGVNLSKYDNLNELHKQADDLKDKTVKVEQPTGVLDVIGGFFYNAYKVLVTVPQSFGLFVDMANQATADSNLGASGVLMRNTLITIMLILVFMGVILSILLKTDRL